MKSLDHANIDCEKSLYLVSNDVNNTLKVILLKKITEINASFLLLQTRTKKY